MTSLPGFHEFQFASDGMRHPVFQKGEGPGVIVMHELMGMTSATVALADRIVDRGFTVFMPLFFGRPNQDGSLLRSALAVCLSKEFHLLARHKSSPITVWLRALSRHVLTLRPGPGVGAIGMCLTGGFILAMMVDESLMAPVMSQPSLPLPLTRAHKHALGTSPDELARARARAAAGLPLLGLRFSGDRVCPRERFETLRQEFGAQFEGIEIPSPDAAHKIEKRAHSVLSLDYVPEPNHPTHQAFERVIAFLGEQLKG